MDKKTQISTDNILIINRGEFDDLATISEERLCQLALIFINEAVREILELHRLNKLDRSKAMRIKRKVDMNFEHFAKNSKVPLTSHDLSRFALVLISVVSRLTKCLLK